MEKEEYKKARKRLGLDVLNWTLKLGISKDSHKSYSCGREKIPAGVANHIETLLKMQEIKSVVETLYRLQLD